MNTTLWTVFIALLWALGGGAVVWLLSYPCRVRSLGWVLGSVVATGVVATVAAVMGCLQVMALTAKDAATTITVALAAGIAASVSAAHAARRFTRDHRALLADVAEVGAGRTPDPHGPRLTAQLEQVRSELAETAGRLAASRERERALESSRRELVSWVSHDLRSPLASLRAMSEALEDGVSQSPETYYKLMRLSVDRLTRMVDDLFELSNIQAGHIVIESERIRVDDLITDCVEAMNPLASSKDVSLSAHHHNEAVAVGSGPELSRALTNLIANAIRHTDSGRSVTVEVESEGDVVNITVNDECGGIPPGNIERVFDVGFRGEEARSPGVGDGGGAGLGLAITRGIVEAHGGSIAVSNLERGCSFALRLPAA